MGDWSDPTDPEFFEIAKHVGSLCLIAVNEHIPTMTTSIGTGSAVRAEVAVVDGPNAGNRYPDALFFGKKIVPQLKASVGSTILGRIGQGEKQPGKNAPYIVEKARPGDADKANAYVKAHGDVESKPIAQTAYQAPSDENWKVAGAAQPGSQQNLPTPPSYPATYTSVGAQSDEAPF
jgi:hypothetical protein